MNDRHFGDVVDGVAATPEAKAEVGVLEVKEKGLIEAADRVECGWANYKCRGGDP
jgi:hypothetical protein